ncbi:RloB family protein [Mesorhizobium sp. M0051]|uniref:RloB family protein n=1 Tax=Mesorhizobium sp. M0051 TaxID=2956862 RepID=UPI0009FFEA6F
MAPVRRGRSSRQYARRAPTRAPYDYVLIICEGSKTEPNYFNGLKADCQLSSANIRVENAAGTDPMTIVSAAEAAIRSREPFDRVYCVFDRDGHQNYDAAIERLNNHSAAKAGKLFAVTSTPCFEIWVSLHFIYSTAAFNAVGKKSSCDHVIDKLKEYFTKYEKEQRTLMRSFRRILKKLSRMPGSSRILMPNPVLITHQLWCTSLSNIFAT